MKKPNNKILIAMGSLLAAAGIGYYLVNRFASDETTTTTIDNGGLGDGRVPTSSGGSSSGPVLGNKQPKTFDLNKILQYGTGWTNNNKEVRELQRMLNVVDNINPLPMLSIDGLFGPKTQAKLLKVTKLKQTTLGQMKLWYPYV